MRNDGHLDGAHHFNNMIFSDIATHLDNSRLHLIIMPTEKCNFRCRYCYEQFEHGEMSLETVEAIKTLLSHRIIDLKYLEIGWFGGEPLLSIDVIEAIGNYALELSKDYGFAFRSSMSTNGSLLDLITAQRVMNAGVGTYQISLDGHEEMHDLTRVDTKGLGTYARIMKNLHDLKNTNWKFEIALRIHVTNKNYDNLCILAKYLNLNFNDDSRFKVYLKKIENLGGSGSFCSNSLVNNSDLASLEKLFPTNMLLRKPRSSPNLCYAAAGNSMVIRSTGQLCKCTVALNDPINIIGNLMKDGRMQINNELYAAWVSTIFMQESAKCPLHTVRRKMSHQEVPEV